MEVRTIVVGSVSKDKYDTVQKESEDQVCEVVSLPPGIILLDSYQQDFERVAGLSNQPVPQGFFLTVIPRDLKITATIRCLTAMLFRPIYQMKLNFDGRMVMSAQSTLFGKLLISQEAEPKENDKLLAKLSYGIGKNLYKLYQKIQETRIQKGGRAELAAFRFYRQCQMAIIPRVDENEQVEIRVSQPDKCYLEQLYQASKLSVTSLKLTIKQFKGQKIKRKYYYLRDMSSTSKTNCLALRNIDEKEWEMTWTWPLCPVQAFGMSLALIDKLSC